MTLTIQMEPGCWQVNKAYMALFTDYELVSLLRLKPWDVNVQNRSP